MSKLREDNATAIQDQSVTVSSDTRCFFTRTASGSDDVSNSLTCGPVRRIGVSDADVWDTYNVQFSQNSKGKVTGTMGDVETVAQPVDAALLVRPDGKKPATADAVPAPQAPRTDIKDTAAVITPESAGDIAFSDLDKSWQLSTPAATIEVTGTATPEFLPADLASSGEDGADVPYFRPADGQHVLAFRLKVGPGPQPGDSGDSSGRQLVSLDTSLKV